MIGFVAERKENSVQVLEKALTVLEHLSRIDGDIDLDAAVLIWNGPRPRDPSARLEPRLVLRHHRPS
jgi:hypothetical protein